MHCWLSLTFARCDFYSRDYNRGNERLQMQIASTCLAHTHTQHIRLMQTNQHHPSECDWRDGSFCIDMDLFKANFE